MNVFSCPACGSRCVSVWRKLTLGSVQSIRCPSCGASVGLSQFWSLFAFLASGTISIVVGAYALLAFSPFTSLAGVLFTFLAAALAAEVPLSLAYCRFVPLVRRGA